MDRCVLEITGDCDMGPLYFDEVQLAQTCKDFVSDVLAIDAVAGVKEVSAYQPYHSSALIQPAVAH